MNWEKKKQEIAQALEQGRFKSESKKKKKKSLSGKLLWV